MKRRYLLSWLVVIIALSTIASGATQSFTINLDNPPNSPSITGNGWSAPCGAGGMEECAGYCPVTTRGWSSSSWEPGHYFDAPFTGEAECTLTLKATSFSTERHYRHQDNEVIEAKVNDVIFARTLDICTGGGSCGCNIARRVSTKTVILRVTGNHITVRRPGDSVEIKGAILTCTQGVSCEEGYRDEYRCLGDWRQKRYIYANCDEEWRNYEHCAYGCENDQCRSGCDPGYLDEYRCLGDWRQRKYQNYDCSTEWGNYEHCAYGCEDDECLPGCDPGYLDEYRCNGNWRQRKYQNYDCSTEWRNDEYCSYTCSGDDCQPGPNPYCTDTDGGIVWSEQGNTYGVDDAFVSYSKLDYCSGDILHEYYCDGNDWAMTYRECDGECRDGACDDPGCEDECEGYGLKECYGDGERVCGYYDTDPCLEWKYYPCDGDCCDDDCDDDCDEGWENEYRCRGNWRQRLWVDDDCDEEWKNYEYCSTGCYNDRCYYNPCPYPPCPPQNYCGDGQCGSGETCGNCPTDCGQCNYCGDGRCDVGETCYNCVQDCGQCNYCGDGACNNGETCYSCPIDCGGCSYCGDGSCNAGESCSNCPSDCGSCSYCGDCQCSAGESCSNCPQDCGSCNYCGDGICGAGETCSSCAQDCGQCSGCGDGVCSGNENCQTCSLDCGVCETCGNGVCDSSESCSSCEQDCGVCQTCGDGSCNNGETCATCSLDCGACDLCGDGVCTGLESCSNCPTDCGQCINPCPVPIGENVEVTAEACIEFEGTGTDTFILTIYSKEDHTADFTIGLSGPASGWSTVQPSTLSLPAGGQASSTIAVTVPEGTAPGLYNLTASISSGGEVISEKQLYVSLSEAAEPNQPPIVVIQDTPTGAFLIGDIDVIWVAIVLAVIINIILAVVFFKKVWS